MKLDVPKLLGNNGKVVSSGMGKTSMTSLVPSKRWQLFFFALAAACIYSGTLNHAFQFDDVQQIVENPRIRELKPWWEYAGNRRSFTIFSFALNYHFVDFDVKYWRIVNIVIHLLNAFLVPVRQNFDYDYPVLESLGDHRALLCLLFILSLFGLAVGMYKRHRIVTFGILWFFIALSVESSIIPLADVIVEHRTYLPSVGFFLVMVYSAFVLVKRVVGVCNLLVLSILVLAFAAFQRNKVWKEPIVFWSDVIEKSPLKARGYNNRGLLIRKRGNMNWPSRIFPMPSRFFRTILQPIGTGVCPISSGKNGIKHSKMPIKL